MRVIDCDCGQTLQAANDDDLAEEVRSHTEESHPDTALSEAEARELVTERAYDAADS